MSHPPPARLSELCDSWEPDGPTLGTVKLQLKPSSATGYKGVNKVKKNVYQARRTVGGTLEHVWTASSPRECAYVLAAVVGGLVDNDQLGQMIDEADQSGRQAAFPTLKVFTSSSSQTSPDMRSCGGSSRLRRARRAKRRLDLR